MDARKDIPQELRRRLRPSDWIAAQTIRLVAVASLLTIFLILVFVVKEAFPVFVGGHQAETTAASLPGSGTASPAASAPESYGEPAPASAASAAPDSSDPYGTPSAAGASAEAPKEHAPFRFLDVLKAHWDPVSTENPSFGIWPLVAGSFKVTLIAMLLAAPIGVLAALYTTTFAPRRLRTFLKPAIEILAGMPSVVIGFFALMIVASLVQALTGGEFRLNALVGGIGLAFTVIPVVFTLSEEAINAVPRHLTEGSLALGATKWETNFLVVLPAATPGIFAALLLGLGRAFGETMIVLMATGNAALIDGLFTTPVRTLSASIGAEMAEVVQGDLHYSVLFFLGVVLFLFSFALNALAEFWVRDRLMRRFKGL